MNFNATAYFPFAVYGAAKNNWFGNNKNSVTLQVHKTCENRIIHSNKSHSNLFWVANKF